MFIVLYFKTEPSPFLSEWLFVGRHFPRDAANRCIWFLRDAVKRTTAFQRCEANILRLLLLQQRGVSLSIFHCRAGLKTEILESRAGSRILQKSTVSKFRKIEVFCVSFHFRRGPGGTLLFVLRCSAPAQNLSIHIHLFQMDQRGSLQFSFADNIPSTSLHRKAPILLRPVWTWLNVRLAGVCPKNFVKGAGGCFVLQSTFFPTGRVQ